MLTPNQLAQLKADILADPALAAQSGTPDGRYAIAAAYNQTASPDFWVWKTYVTKNEVVSSTGPGGTTWTWVGDGFITRSVGEKAAWVEIWNASGSINPSLPQVRQAFADILSGGAGTNAAANRTHMLAVCRRKATRAEKLFAAGVGGPAVADVATMGFEGVVTGPDVDAALNLP